MNFKYKKVVKPIKVKSFKNSRGSYLVYVVTNAH